jgi:hypothetical protein
VSLEEVKRRVVGDGLQFGACVAPLECGPPAGSWPRRCSGTLSSSRSLCGSMMECDIETVFGQVEGCIRGNTRVSCRSVAEARHDPCRAPWCITTGTCACIRWRGPSATPPGLTRERSRALRRREEIDHAHNGDRAAVVDVRFRHPLHAGPHVPGLRDKLLVRPLPCRAVISWLTTSTSCNVRLTSSPTRRLDSDDHRGGHLGVAVGGGEQHIEHHEPTGTPRRPTGGDLAHQQRVVIG